MTSRGGLDGGSEEVDEAAVVESILCGRLDRLPPAVPRSVCVFISSTFSDMAPERNALMQHVYPQLKEFCRKEYRLEFQMMDLRWGIREQSLNDHTIIEFCLREIDKCRTKSIGPNFVALLGQKYGYRPFPPTIDADEFTAIRAELAGAAIDDDGHENAGNERQASLLLLDTWFKCNTNVIPPVYRLQPISSVLPDYSLDSDYGLVLRCEHRSRLGLNSQFHVLLGKLILHCSKSPEDSARKQKAFTEWESIYCRLRHCLRQGVTSCVIKGKLPAASKDRYFISVTEYEIERGMLSCPGSCNSSSLCFMRSIDGLANNLSNPKSRLYLDVVPDANRSSSSTTTAELDVEAQTLLEDLKRKVTGCLTDERNLEYFELDWKTDKQGNFSDDQQYLKNFCDSFRDKLQWLISRAAERCLAETGTNLLQPRVVEIVQHLTMCRDRSREFQGRDDVLCLIRDYIRPAPQQHQQPRRLSDLGVERVSPSRNRPLVLCGESGSGKTSVVARVASLINEWSRKDTSKPLVVLRFLGTTSQSCNIRLLLASVCWHIASVYQRDTVNLPTDYPSLVAHFHTLLTVPDQSRPLVILLDGLDQLGTAHRAHSLAWLPTTLSPFVRLVLSSLQQNDKHDLLHTLRALLSPCAENFVRITALGAQLSMSVVRERLKADSRTLTSGQLSVVETAMSKCSLPLYVRLVSEEVCRWSSYQPDSETVVQQTVDDIINTLFDRLELYHGKVFVSHALSYLTASRNGLSDAELEDILSLDDTVLNDVFQHWLPPLRRLPPLLIPRLVDELGRYLTEREANGTTVVYWYHSQFIAVARRRYLGATEQHRCDVHATLAHYYLGTWARGRRKPFRYSKKQLRCVSATGKNKGKPRKLEDEADRLVSEQPLAFGSVTMNGCRQVRYNVRKLSELPYHLIESGMKAELRKHVLFNYEWLHSKLAAMSMPDVLADFHMATTSFSAKDATDFQLLAGALRVGGANLSHNPDTLAFDLVARLLHYYDNEDHDVQQYRRGSDAPALPSTMTASTTSGAGLKSLLQQCDADSTQHSALLPILPSFDPPTAMSVFILEGHSQMISDVVFCPATNELVSISKDGTLVFWDLVSGERSRSIDVSAVRPGRCTRLYVADATCLVVDFDTLDSLAHVYDVITGRLLHACALPRLPSLMRGFVAGRVLCRQKCLVDVHTGVLLATLDEFVESKSYVVCVLTPDARFLLVGEPAETRMFALTAADAPTQTDEDDEMGGGRRHRPVARFPASCPSSAIAVSTDSTRAFVGQSSDCLFSVLDIDFNCSNFGQVIQTVDCSMLSSSPVVSGTSLDSNEQQCPNEISEIAVSPLDRCRVVVSINRCRPVVLTVADGSSPVRSMALDLPPSDRVAGPVLQSVAFNHCGEVVIASTETWLVIWAAETGHTVHTLNLHTTPGYPLAVHAERNLVATGSTIHTAVMVWDLDKVETSNAPVTKVYEGPVDCVAVAANVQLVFVKNHFGLTSSNRSYRYVGNFGVDVWNLSTGTWRTVLPFDKYGRLLQLEVSPDAVTLALLLVDAAASSYVIVFDIDGWPSTARRILGAVDDDDDAEVRCVAPHEGCSMFVISPAWDFMATASTGQQSGQGDVRLWNLDTGNAIVHFQEATSPVFTYDGLHLLYIDRGCTVIAYSLSDLAPKYHVPDCLSHQLIALPVYHRLFLAVHFEQKTATVSIADLSCRSTVGAFQTAVGGLLDVSKDGRRGVDGMLQVFDVHRGNIIISFSSHLSSTHHLSSGVNVERVKLVRLTADGKYVVWSSGVEVRVGRVTDGFLMARTSTHETLTCLECSMDAGYVVIAGRKDGRLMAMKLLLKNDHRLRETTARDVDERRRILLHQPNFSDDSLKDVDPLFRRQARCLSDRQLPVAADAVMDAILRLADVPHAVISTGSTTDQQQRAQSSQARVERRRPPRGLTSSPRRRASGGSNHWRNNGVRPTSSDAHLHLRATTRSSTPSPVTVGVASTRLSFGSSRGAQTLDRLERTASDFDVHFLADSERSTTLPKSDVRGLRDARRRRGLPGGKGGGASDGDDIDSAPTRLPGKRRTHFRFINLFRSSDKSSDTSKPFSRKTTSRKMWDTCL